MSAKDFKDKGNAFLKSKDFNSALECYNQAIILEPCDHIHYSNRSACYLSMGKNEFALSDANKCIELKPDWSKGYQRKAQSEIALDNITEAEKAVTKGLELEPQNPILLNWF